MSPDNIEHGGRAVTKKHACLKTMIATIAFAALPFVAAAQPPATQPPPTTQPPATQPPATQPPPMQPAPPTEPAPAQPAPGQPVPPATQQPTGSAPPASAPADNGAMVLLNRISELVEQSLGHPAATQDQMKAKGTSGVKASTPSKNSAGLVSVERATLDEIKAEVDQLKIMLAQKPKS
jgi:hypothetical protein